MLLSSLYLSGNSLSSLSKHSWSDTVAVQDTFKGLETCCWRSWRTQRTLFETIGWQATCATRGTLWRQDTPSKHSSGHTLSDACPRHSSASLTPQKLFDILRLLEYTIRQQSIIKHKKTTSKQCCKILQDVARHCRGYSWNCSSVFSLVSSVCFSLLGKRKLALHCMEPGWVQRQSTTTTFTQGRQILRNSATKCYGSRTDMSSSPKTWIGCCNWLDCLLRVLASGSGILESKENPVTYYWRAGGLHSTEYVLGSAFTWSWNFIEAFVEWCHGDVASMLGLPKRSCTSCVQIWLRSLASAAPSLNRCGCF